MGVPRQAAEDSPIRDHFVTTILGPRLRASIGDPLGQVTLGWLTDYQFLPGGDVLIADSFASRIYRGGADGLLRPFAGNGKRTTSGDGGSALDAGIFAPYSLAVDPYGVVYTMQADGAIRRIAVDGTISTIAGNGQSGCPTVGALATETQMSASAALAADGEGNVYIAPLMCGAVFRIDAHGIVHIATGYVAGSPSPERPITSSEVQPAGRYSVDLVLDMSLTPAGELLVVGQSSGDSRYSLMRVAPGRFREQILLIEGYGDQREGAKVTLALQGISGFGLRADGSVLVTSKHGSSSYVSRNEAGVVDRHGNYSILFTEDGYEGHPTGKIGDIQVYPERIRFDAGGNAYLLDASRQAIVRLHNDGTLEPFVGVFEGSYGIEAGPASDVRMSSYVGFAADSQGRVLIGYRQMIHRLEADASLTHIAGDPLASSHGDGGSAVAAWIEDVPRMETDAAGNLYIRETRAGTRGLSIVMRKIAADGTIDVCAGGGNTIGDWEGLTATSADLGRYVPEFTVSAAGEIYLVENPSGKTARIWKRKTDGTLTRVFGSLENTYNSFPQPGTLATQTAAFDVGKLAVDAAGTLYFQAGSFPNLGIYRIDQDGIVRTVVNHRADQSFADGDPTIDAPGRIEDYLKAIGVGRLLTRLPSSGLIEYVDGGNTRQWMDQDGAIYRNDGAFVAEDASISAISVAMLPDGGLAYVQNGLPFAVVRRTFPVPEGCAYSLSSQQILAPASGLETNVAVSTGMNCPWSWGASSYWTEIDADVLCKGTKDIPVSIAPNPSPEQRETTIVIAGVTVKVLQAGNADVTLFAVSPRLAKVPAGGGDVRLDITASTNLSWQIGLPASGVSVNGATTGNGTATRILQVGSLPGSDGRTLTVTVNGIAVSITQAAVPGLLPVVIAGDSPKSKIFVDFVAQPLPFHAMWTVGSRHHVLAEEWQKAGENSLLQFIDWESGATSPEQLLRVTQAASLTARFRTLHAVNSARAEESSPGQASGTELVFGYLGVQVPSEILQRLGMVSSYPFYPEGEAVPILAVANINHRFLRFHVDPLNGASNVPVWESTTNPSAVVVDGPLQLTATFNREQTAYSALYPKGGHSIPFRGSVVRVNPQTVPVLSSKEGPESKVSGLFVRYASSKFSLPSWLETRVSNGGQAPFVIELQPNPDDPALKSLNAGFAQASVYLLSDTTEPAKLDYSLAVMSPRTGDAPSINAVTDAGGFRPGTDPAAKDSIVTIFGERLANGIAGSESLPLPVALEGASVEWQHPNTLEWIALPLFYVSPYQINVHLPASILPNSSKYLRIRAKRDGIVSETEMLSLRSSSPSFFTANSSGLGAPSGFYVRVLPNGSQERGELAQCQNGACTPRSLVRGGAGNKLFLELYGTGLNDVVKEDVRILLGGRELQPDFVGPHGQFIGLSQVNVEIPADLEKGTPLDLYVWSTTQEDSRAVLSSNRLTIVLQ